MSPLTHVPFGRNFIAELADRLLEAAPVGNDLGGLTVVFPGRRPALYLRRELARRLGGAFFPPRCFSIDDFIDRLVARRLKFQPLTELEAAYFLYQTVGRLDLEIPPAKHGFARFLPWGREMIAFLDQLDLEDVPPERLRDIEHAAELGYDAPDSVNRLLGDLAVLREAYHGRMAETGRLSRGMRYRRAAADCAAEAPGEFGTVFFGDFFYLCRSEAAVIASFLRAGRGRFLFQAHPGDWPVMAKSLRRLDPAGEFAAGLLPANGPGPEVTLATGFDAHSQAALVREFIAGVPAAERADLAVVLPEPVSLLPFLSEISGELSDFNVSLGYPLRRTSLYALFRTIFAAQESRRDGRYYARDYLAVLSHPLVKNFALAPGPAATRLIVHRIEECLLGMVESPFSGKLFVCLDEVELFPGLLRDTGETVAGADAEGAPREALGEIHRLFFRAWEGGQIGNFRQFGRVMETLIGLLSEKSCLLRYPLNREFSFAVLEIVREIAAAPFRDEDFPAPEIFRVFMEKMVGGTVNFRGSPLRGTQVLGLLETRGLDFGRVVFMDVNESALPRVRTAEPLIPREVMLSLGLDLAGCEEEIQRYYFRRLVAGARHAHLVYSRAPRLEPSRFLEGLAWERQRAAGDPAPLATRHATFRLERCPPAGAAAKSPEVLAFLGDFEYSPTALDDYLACPYLFYHRHVLGLGEKEELGEEPRGREIGIFLHSFLAAFFRAYTGRRPLVDAAFRGRFLAALESAFHRDLAGRIRAGDFLVLGALKYNLGRFLDLEAEQPPAEIVCVEEKIRDCLVLNGRTYRFSCRIDRIDRAADGGLLVIDYKAGGSTEKLKPRADMVARLATAAGRREIRHALRSFQLPVYAFFARRRYGAENVRAVYCSLRGGRRVEFPDGAGMNAETADACQGALAAVLGEINDPGTNFEPDESACRYCAYTRFCR